MCATFRSHAILTVLLLVLPIFLSSLVLPIVFSSPAQTTVRLRWILTGTNISRLQAEDPSNAAYHFDTPRAYAIGDEDGIQNQVTAGYSSIPVLKYESYARFHSDIQNRRIDPSIATVMYDPEAWAATPNIEKRDPKRFLRQFARLGHRHGYQVINAPSRDLVVVPFAYCRKRPRETISNAYLRCGIATEGARFADAFVIQAQVHERNPAAYRSFVRLARDQARATNSRVLIFANLATSPADSNATARMLWNSHRAVVDLVVGHGLTINAGEEDIAQQFLRMVRAAGR